MKSDQTLANDAKFVISTLKSKGLLSELRDCGDEATETLLIWLNADKGDALPGFWNLFSNMDEDDVRKVADLVIKQICPNAAETVVERLLNETDTDQLVGGKSARQWYVELLDEAWADYYANGEQTDEWFDNVLLKYAELIEKKTGVDVTHVDYAPFYATISEAVHAGVF